MLKPRSALEGTTKFEAHGLSISEAPNFTLTQFAGDEKRLKRALGEVPAMGSALKQDGLTLLRVSPSQVWVLGTPPETTLCAVTALSSSRVRVALDGENTRKLLKALAAIDFDMMKSGSYVMTGIHHVPVLIHCTGKNAFHIYVMRTFALSIWNWLIDAAQDQA